ncbi:hypothetical protein GIW81_11390 [Hyphomicrobium sp. xq]|uniref:Peptidoglycan binding domain-containing protein n=1 Tax=Hyphomicrobium album TaxID=2665159 RepID=A0A6I3KIR2_9HYPH|nr:peptidoglycan-binding domain-containing protein [Hyphomicrobium album]MTD94934.1 hypothetical protein [Hyphomicrobium album]
MVIEFFMISIGLMSGGFFFRDALAQRPIYELVAGVVVIAATLTWGFEMYGLAAVKWEQLNEYQRQTEIDSENAARAEKIEVNRELQTELKRLGCYGGPLDGVWGDQSSAALSEFLKAVGRQDEFGDSVKVSDARAMFSAAPDQVCSTAAATRVTTTMRRYKSAYNSHVKNCTDYVFVFRVRKRTPECTALQANRDRYARQLEAMGVQPPG